MKEISGVDGVTKKESSEEKKRPTKRVLRAQREEEAEVPIEEMERNHQAAGPKPERAL